MRFQKKVHQINKQNKSLQIRYRRVLILMFKLIWTTITNMSKSTNLIKHLKAQVLPKIMLNIIKHRISIKINTTIIIIIKINKMILSSRTPLTIHKITTISQLVKNKNKMIANTKIFRQHWDTSVINEINL